MGFKLFRIRAILAALLFVALAAGFLVSHVLPTVEDAQRASCANNLRLLYESGLRYASTHQGHWPDKTGSALWRSLAITSPPLVSADAEDVLLCPVRTGKRSEGGCSYLGPRNPASSLKDGDALGACTHDRESRASTGSVLLKDGTVQEYKFTHPIWGTLAP